MAKNSRMYCDQYWHYRDLSVLLNGNYIYGRVACLFCFVSKMDIIMNYYEMVCINDDDDVDDNSNSNSNSNTATMMMMTILTSMRLIRLMFKC